MWSRTWKHAFRYSSPSGFLHRKRVYDDDDHQSEPDGELLESACCLDVFEFLSLVHVRALSDLRHGMHLHSETKPVGGGVTGSTLLRQIESMARQYEVGKFATCIGMNGSINK